MISNECKLVLQDLYLYDFKSAYPRLLSSIGWDFEGVDLTNKQERSIAIGMAQKDNKNLSAFLIESITQHLEYYLKENGVKDEEIIVTQRDGFILTRSLPITDGMMKLDFREHMNLVIITPDRKKYLAASDTGITVKGIKNYYPALDDVYREFLKLTIYNRRALFAQMERIQKKALHNPNKEFYMVQVKDKSIVQTHKGPIEVTNPRYFKLDSVDTQKYFDHYFKEFFQALMLEYF